jgi:hypothetical protein
VSHLWAATWHTAEDVSPFADGVMESLGLYHLGGSLYSLLDYAVYGKPIPSSDQIRNRGRDILWPGSSERQVDAAWQTDVGYAAGFVGLGTGTAISLYGATYLAGNAAGPLTTGRVAVGGSAGTVALVRTTLATGEVVIRVAAVGAAWKYGQSSLQRSFEAAARTHYRSQGDDKSDLDLEDIYVDDELVDLYHGTKQFEGEQFSIESAVAHQRPTHLTDKKPGIFFTDDVARAAQSYATPEGVVVRVRVPRGLANKVVRTDPSTGKREWVFRKTEDIEYLNRHLEILPFREALEKWWLLR